MRRLGLGLLTAITFFASSAFAKDVFLNIAGSVGAFRTDARIFNLREAQRFERMLDRFALWIEDRFFPLDGNVDVVFH